MIINKVGYKNFRVGCGRGHGVEIPNLSFKLNLIVDKERSGWKEGDETKELEPGDTFEVDGTVLAVDGDRLVQVVSETGPCAVDRIVREKIGPELELLDFKDEENEYSWQELTSLPDGLEKLENPPQALLSIWTEKFVTPDRKLNPDYTIEVSMTDVMLGLQTHVWFKPGEIYYNLEEISGEELREWYLKKIVAWFYENE